MDKPVELIPLLCIRCNAPLPAQADELAWACTQCGQGMQLDPASGLAPLEIHAATGIPANQPGKPYWVAEGRVTLQRDTFSGNAAQDASAFWSSPRRFTIPAYDCPLETLLSQGTQYLLQPPELVEGPPASFAPVTFSAQDARTLAEFIVVAIEASRRDMLKEIRFELDFSPPALWILP